MKTKKAQTKKLMKALRIGLAMECYSKLLFGHNTNPRDWFDHARHYVLCKINQELSQEEWETAQLQYFMPA